MLFCSLWFVVVFYSFICSAAVQVYFIVNIVDLSLLVVLLLGCLADDNCSVDDNCSHFSMVKSPYFMVKSQCLVLKSASFQYLSCSMDFNGQTMLNPCFSW